MAASSSLNEEDMEVVLVLEDGKCVDMDVDLPDEQHMILELQTCRSKIKVTMPTQSHQEFFGLPVESSRVNYSDYLYLVLDTNVLLSHLKFLKELKDLSIKGIGKPVLVVPWVVIQELDALKNSKRRVANQATRAGSFISDCLSAKHPRVRGQTVEEVNTEVQNLSIENNDDRILHCCLVYQHKIRTKNEQGVVILFSNDTMLCVKAKMNKVTSCDRKNLLSELKGMSDSSSSVPVSYTHTTEYVGKVGQQLAEDKKSRLVDDCLCQAENYAKDAFSIIIEHEMKSVYGELCNDIMLRKPPWNLEDVMVMLDKHWVAVFRYFFTAAPSINNQDKVKSLLNHVKQRSTKAPRPPQVLSFIDNTLHLLEQMRNKPAVWSKISLLVASIKVLKEKVEKPHLPPSPPTTPTYAYPSTPPTIMPIVTTSQPVFLPHLSQSLYHIIDQCPPLAVNQLHWIFQVIRESLVCGIISAQTSYANSSFTRQSEMWLLDLLRYLESLIVCLENVLNQGLYIPVLRALYDSIIIYFSNVLSIACPLAFSQLCDICQLEGIVPTFQEGLGFVLDGRLQLLQILHQTAQNHLGR